MTRTNARIALAALLCLLALPALGQPHPEIRAFWADGFNEGFKTPEQVDTLLRRLHDANCNGIFAQMRKRGDAYYASHYEPWASDDQGRWDALAYLIERAHSMSPRIQVHAWINTCAVGGMRTNSHHIISAHPEWLSLSDKGADYDDEATKIDPGNPDAADWTFRVYLDVTRHYNVDGVHFDFVRYGGTNWGYNPVSVARYNARYGLTGQPEPADPRWKQWRRDQATALVRKVYAMAYGVNRKVAISAATITWGEGPRDVTFWNEKTAPMNRVFQDWRAWMREGILDLNCLMSYYNEKKHADWYRYWINWAKDNQYHRWAVPSSGIWFNTVQDSFTQIAAIRKPSKQGNRPHGVLLYSYGGTNTGPDGKEQTYNEEFYKALGAPSSYAAAPPFAQPVEFPSMPWKTRPTMGQVKGFVLTADGLNPVDGAFVTLSGRVRRAQHTDGTGFYAFIDVPPGRYTITVRAKGYAARTASARVGAGEAVTSNEFLGSAPTGFTPDLAAIAALPSGAPVRVKGVTVVGGTDTFPGVLYVRGGAGPAVRVRLSQTPLVPYQPGDVVALSGKLMVQDGEKVIDGADARLVDMRLFDAAPRTARAAALCTGAGAAPGFATLSGKVLESRPDRFVLDSEGTRVEVMTTGCKGQGVEDVETPVRAPDDGSWVQVTGVPTAATAPDGKPMVRLHPRIQADLVALATPLAERLFRAAEWSALALFDHRRPLAAR